MLCHLEKEGNYERRGCNVITAGPIVSASGGSIRAAGRTQGPLVSISPRPLLGMSGF